MLRQPDMFSTAGSTAPLRPGPVQWRHQRGSAVITVLVLAAVTAVIASGFLFRSAQEAKLATRSFFQSVALNLAEAGIEEGLFSANTNTITSANGWQLVSGSTTDYQKSITSGFNFQQATGAIYIRIDAAATATPTIIAAGVVTIPNQPRIVKQLRVTSAGPARIWGNSIVSRGNVTFSGTALIDGYDSTLGLYNPATNRNDHATVATNATVQVTSSADIYGYVATAGAQPSVGSTGRIYGATSPATPLVDPTHVRTDFNANLTDASAPTGTAISLGATYSSGSLPRSGDTAGTNGRYLYTVGALSIGGSNAVNINGPVDIIVTGNTSISGSATLAISSNATLNPSLNLYCPGTIDIGGSGLVNNQTSPTKLGIWGTKPSGGAAQAINIGGSSAFKGTVYAANGEISVSGSGGVYGAFVGGLVTLASSCAMHYDVQLANVGSAGGPTPQSGTGYGYHRINTWNELTEMPGTTSAFARDNRAPFTSFF